MSGAWMGAIVLAVALAGCTDDSSTTDSRQDWMSQPSDTSSQPVASKGDEFRLVFSECEGAIAVGYLPPTTGPPPIFDAWAASELAPTELGYEYYICKRVSMGTLERGPVRFMFELHDNGNPPTPACQGDRLLVTYLHATYWDDAELAATFAAVTGVPTYVATMSETHDSPAAGISTYSIDVADKGKSAFSILRSDSSPTGGATHLERYAWARGAGVGFLNLTTQASRPSDAIPLSEGEFGSPTLWNQYAGTAFAGQGDYPTPWVITDVQLSFFEDQYCKVPSPGPTTSSTNTTTTTTATP